ncbi:MAG TPA: tail fiber domain-containing protein [Thermoanaerobaculia bacterium]|nr:tail fiber domain-containing protein [Thermoanaerobaculia bacterium]
MSRKSLQSRITVVFFAVTVAFGAFAKDGIGRATGGGTQIEWQSKITGHEKIVLRVIDLDGNELQLSFGPGRNPVFRIADLGGAAADGQYTYELRVEPRIPEGLKKKLEEARANGDDATVRKIQKDNGLGQAITQSGVITIKDNTIVSPEGTEPTAKDSASASPADSARFGGVQSDARPGEVTVDDTVIPDDLIVQSSTCTGFDCVNGESFGVDTLRLKENNLRIHFEDTSTSAGYAANDWRIIANEQPSGGANMFAIEDSTAGRNPFLIEAAAPASSIYVDSTGNIGFQQSAPGLDLHLTTSDTPALRLDQSNAGGFTAQTWDIGGNEANFFIRDLTGGSRLPFRIRPGAPTSSIDISATGNIGIATASPDNYIMDINTGTTNGLKIFYIESATSEPGIELASKTTGTFTRLLSYNRLTNLPIKFFIQHATASSGTYFDTNGYVGFGVASPTQPLQHSNGGYLSTTGQWINASSRELKQDIATLSSGEALEALNGLAPVKYNYRSDPSDAHVGFIAEDVPELVAEPTRKGISSLDVTAVLAKVVQDQQKQIEELSRKIEQLQKNQQ